MIILFSLNLCIKIALKVIPLRNEFSRYIFNSCNMKIIKKYNYTNIERIYNSWYRLCWNLIFDYYCVKLAHWKNFENFQRYFIIKFLYDIKISYLDIYEVCGFWISSLSIPTRKGRGISEFNSDTSYFQSCLTAACAFLHRDCLPTEAHLTTLSAAGETSPRQLAKTKGPARERG